MYQVIRTFPNMEYISKLLSILLLIGTTSAISANSEELYGSEEYESGEYEYSYEEESERALGSLTNSNYYSKFAESSKELLRTYDLWNKTMKRDDSWPSSVETIKWTQWSRCGWKYCTQDYVFYDYMKEGDPKNATMKVYIAKGITPPEEFNTLGYDNKLHFGFLGYGEIGQAMYFVIHPNDLYPYQHRFKTNRMTEFIHSQAAVLAQDTAIAVGMIAGSLIAGPGVGTFIGGAGAAYISAAAASNAENYFGDYLRYIG